MWFRARVHSPAHARTPAVAARRGLGRRGGVTVLALYVAVIGANEWRLHQHVAQAKERPALVAEAAGPVAGPGGPVWPVRVRLTR